MNPIEQICAAFQKTFDDETLSRSERKAMRSFLSDFELDQREMDVLRSKIFDIAEQGMKDHNDRFVLEWVESASRILDKIGDRDEKSGSRVYFSPGNRCKDAIIAQIDGARKTLDICVFTISDDDISRRIISRHQLGTRVRIITDNEKLHDKGSDIEKLAQAGIQVRVDRSEYHMHHKYAVVDQRLAITGSYNWTRSAAKYNEENILLTEEASVVKSYQDGFDKMWRKMDRF